LKTLILKKPARDGSKSQNRATDPKHPGNGFESRRAASLKKASFNAQNPNFSVSMAKAGPNKKNRQQQLLTKPQNRQTNTNKRTEANK